MTCFLQQIAEKSEKEGKRIEWLKEILIACYINMTSFGAWFKQNVKNGFVKQENLNTNWIFEDIKKQFLKFFRFDNGIVIVFFRRIIFKIYKLK